MTIFGIHICPDELNMLCICFAGIDVRTCLACLRFWR